MSRFTELIQAAQVRDSVSGTSSRWKAVLEIVVVMFFISLIPKMIVMDPQNIHWYDFWEPLLSAILAGIYTYSRARDLDLGGDDAE
jgi:hypothetical protein